MRIRNFLHALPVCIALGTMTVGGEILPPGHRPLPHDAHALTNATVVVQPGQVLSNATILLRAGRIERVGAGIPVPADARAWDLTGLTVYAGFIDPYLTLGSVRSAAPSTKTQRDLTSGRFFGVPGGELDPGGAGPGSEINGIHADRRMAENYAPDPKLLEKLRELGFTSANVVPEKGIFRGTSAFVLLSDADPNRSVLKADVFHHVSLNPEGGREDGYPASLMGAVAAIRQTLMDARHHATDHADYAKNANRKRPEFNPAHAALRPVIEKKAPIVFEPPSALMLDRATRIAHEADIPFLILATGQEWRRPEFAKAAGVPLIVPVNFPELSKLPDEDDWNQLTLDQLRTWDWAPESPALLRQHGLEVALTTYGLGERKNFRRNLKGAVERGLSEADALAALTTIPAKLCGVADRVGTVEAGKLANLTIVEGNYFDGEGKVRDVWIDGRYYRVQAAKEARKEPKKEEDEKARAEKEKKEALKKRVARSPLERRGPLATPKYVLVRNAVLWTCSSKGILTNASIYVSEGKIHTVGHFKSEVGPDTLVIDAQGKHVTPGLIDCHSHSMILGAVNEFTLPSSAMVRIGDVVNSETANIYEQLAGGLTVANLLHGSANPIGGQNCVIKLRDGAPPEDLKFGAPEGIKFALGENVKQANWGEKYTTRFPQTRMGVWTFINNRFTAGRQYLQERERAGRDGAAPFRRDLELEAIGEILQGGRWIHCHSYRQDEILAFLRLMESFGVKVGTLQHVLEGYKVADEIAAHGAGASSFADWWAYKFEVYDAIPHNGSLMHERGVLVSFNSDSSDLARRMNFEAAKAVKFGGTAPEEALNFVTINPARQLRIDHRVGSLESGKDADFVLWSGHPLDTGSICLQTWIDGQKYFDRDQAPERAAAREAERKALVEKAKKVLNVSGGGGEADPAGKQKFFEHSLEHEHDGHARHCDDE